MKQIRFVFLIILVLAVLSSCTYTKMGIQKEQTDMPHSGNSQTSNTGSESQTEEIFYSVSGELQLEENKNSTEGESRKILVAYFSWSENAIQDNIDAMTSASVRVPGNVAQLAAWIAEETGGDLFSIQVAKRYPADWDDCLERANEEKANGIHPKLAQTLENIDDYDTIFLGYPNWWYSCPMAIHSFLDTHVLSGKQVYLFCFHGTGGLANSVNDIAADIPDAILSKDVFHVYQDDTASAKESLVTWLEGLED